MTPAYQCPKCGCTLFVAVRPVYSYSPGLFGGLWSRQDGILVNCTRHACGRPWIITRSGLEEPAEAAIPGRTIVRQVAPPTRSKDDERDDGEPVPGDPLPRARV